MLRASATDGLPPPPQFVYLINRASKLALGVHVGDVRPDGTLHTLPIPAEPRVGAALAADDDDDDDDALDGFASAAPAAARLRWAIVGDGVLLNESAEREGLALTAAPGDRLRQPGASVHLIR
jgi:hypothetical protein